MFKEFGICPFLRKTSSPCLAWWKMKVVNLTVGEESNRENYFFCIGVWWIIYPLPNAPWCPRKQRARIMNKCLWVGFMAECKGGFMDHTSLQEAFRDFCLLNSRAWFMVTLHAFYAVSHREQALSLSELNTKAEEKKRTDRRLGQEVSVP